MERAASPRWAACICHVVLDAACLEVEIMYVLFLIWEEKKSWGNIFFLGKKSVSFDLYSYCSAVITV